MSQGVGKDFFVLFYFLPFCNRIKIVDKLLNGWGFFTIFNISDFFDSVCKLKGLSLFLFKNNNAPYPYA